MNWIKITGIENIPARQGRSVRVENRELAIFNLVDRFMAIDNQCPHRGGPLCDGIVAGTTVVCPLHGWKISLESGMSVKPSAPVCLETYQTRVEDGVILVQLPDAEEEREEVAA